METHCIRHTELPHTTKLFTDLVYHFDRVSDLYEHRPYDDEALRASAAQAIAGLPPERRAAIVAALRQQNGDQPSLDVLAQAGSVAVVTGQQAGLFGGPAYTIFKAMAAIRLAEKLTADGTPAVPVFWLATEDHDLEEINQAWLFDGEPRLVKTSATNPLNGPVGPIVATGLPLEELRASLHGTPYAEEVYALVTLSYKEGATFGAAFRGLLQELLGKYGLLFLDPLSPAIREVAALFLRAIPAKAAELTAALLDRNKELESRGYHAQVHVEPDATLLFLLEEGRRIPVKRSTPDLAARAASLSPNALLRPVMQDYLLPTAAYFGGPAELAYFAQASVLYRALLGRMPVMLPRASFTLLDAKIEKKLAKYQLTVPQVFTGETALRQRMALHRMPSELREKLDASVTQVEAILRSMAAAMDGLDPTLAKATAKSRAKIIYQFEKLRNKSARELLRREANAGQDADLLHNALYPQGHLQERFYSIVPFLARHGLGLIDTLHDSTHVECPDHQVLSLH